MKVLLSVVAVAATVLALSGCSRTQNDSTVDIVDVGNSKILDGTTQNIEFKTDKEKTRFQKILNNIENLTDAGWKAEPFEAGGNFYRKDLCKRATADDYDCFQTNNIFKGDSFYQLSVLFYNKELPIVFGIGVEAMQMPAKSGWGIDLSYREDGKSIFQKHLIMDFLQFDEENSSPIKTITLGNIRNYSVSGNVAGEITYSTKTSEQSEFELYLKSPESFKNRALETIDKHYQEVVDSINRNELKIEKYGEPGGPGEPEPVIGYRNLTDEEKRDALGEAKKDFDKEKSIIASEYKELYQLLKAVSPFERVF